MMLLILLCVCLGAGAAEAVCSVQQCEAMAILVVTAGDLLFNIATRFEVEGGFTILQTLNNISDVLALMPGQNLRVPFSCSCMEQTQQMGHVFHYSVPTSGAELFSTIASADYSNLTRPEWIASANPSYNGTTDAGAVLSIPVNCSCGDAQVSEDYGLFGTYVAQPNDNLSGLSRGFSVPQSLLSQYNPTGAFDHLEPFVSIIFVPLKNSSGQFPPFTGISSSSPTSSSSKGTIFKIAAGLGGAVAFVIVGSFAFWFLYAKFSGKHRKRGPLLGEHSSEVFELKETSRPALNKSGTPLGGGFIHFSYEQLAAITGNFNLSREIGRGAFGVVYYGEFEGQVQLVGYCKEGFLFLVYEYIDNGSLKHHLESTGTNALSWEQRVQIALDAARGIEYIHDHTNPTYTHRDIKPANILIDMNYRAKVADFGLAKFIDPDGLYPTTSTGGTFGYMPPECILGRFTVKGDVYAFGVVMFQLISAKEALLCDCLTEHKELVKLFKEFLSKPNAREELRYLVDPALGDAYPVESAWKMAILAERCTNFEPESRPLMREVVSELSNLQDPR